MPNYEDGLIRPLFQTEHQKYSLGMKQKIGIIQAIMENSDLLILDEPFNALDEDSVKLLRRLLLQYQQEGKLIIITSHHKEDIDSICSYILLLQDGKLVQEIKLGEILAIPRTVLSDQFPSG